MATSSHEKTKSGGAGDRSFAEQVDDLLECAICTEVMKSPKVLPCTHSFCLECLQQYINNKDPKQRTNTCPICRSPFRASKMMSLPDNLLAKKFLEFREKLKKTSAEEESRERKISEPWCENCCDESEDSQQSPEAIKYCEQCDQNLCLRCVEAHRVLKITSTHSLVDLIVPKKTSTSHTSCPNHPSRQVTTYCEDCICFACEECVETDHCFHATTVMEHLAAELRNDALQADSRAEHLEQMIQLTEEDKAQLLDRITETEGKIHREAERLHALVNEGKAQLLEELGFCKKKMMKQFAAYVEGVECSALMLHGCGDRFNRLANMASRPTATSIDRVKVEAEQQRQETRDVFAIRQARPRHDLNVVFANDMIRSNYIGEIVSNLRDEGKTEEPKDLDEDDGCDHYKRRCSLKASCCSQVYTCHHCHDASEDHKLDRTRVSTVVCHLCGTEQPVARWCRSCDVDFGRYYCAICRIYDDNDKGQFHCDECTICRLGGRHNYWHCDRCGICISTSLSKTHQCIAGAALDDCQICGKAMFDSTECLRMLPCGHFIHSQCLIDHPDLKRNCLSCAESGRNSK